MYVVPDTHLEFFQNLNIDSDYENTIYFPTTQAKDDYFAQLPSIKTPRCTYQREKRGYCRVEIPIGQLYGRCYMRFRNNQFENKWFYAFVDNVEYINDITTEVQYTNDVMMTWMGGSYTLDECFIERQHSETDNIGDNLVPETILPNRYVSNDYFSIEDQSIQVPSQLAPQRSGCLGTTNADWKFIVVMEPDINDPPAGVQYGYYSALNYIIKDTPQLLSDYIQGLSGTDQLRVQGIFMVPSYFIPTGSQSAPKRATLSIRKPIAGNTTIGGHTPSNNKLYTYPYNYIRVLNTEGEQLDLPFENFDSNGIATFEFRGVVGERTQITCTPVVYESVGWNVVTNPVDPRTQLTMTDFPMIAWVTDTFKAFLAQQLVSLPLDVAHGFMSGIMTGEPEDLARGALNIVDRASQLLRVMMHPREAKGTNTPNLALCGLYPYKDFWFYRISARADDAKRIDDYFTMFGYAQNVVAKPNINARPYFTYVKTLGCHINGSFPEEDKRQIESIFNRGVRFWKEDHRYIGKYSEIDNSPTGA